MRYIVGLVTFVVVFGLVFFISGWYLLQFLPWVAKTDVNVTDTQYWKNNWIGCVLGAALGALCAWGVGKRR